MIKVDISNIPQFLKDSPRLKTINVPREYVLPKNFTITNDNDLRKILNVTKFWKVNKLPEMIYDYLMTISECNIDFDKHYPEDTFPLIKDVKFLLNARKRCPRLDYDTFIAMVVKADLPSILKYGIDYGCGVPSNLYEIAEKHGSNATMNFAKSLTEN